MTGDPWIKSWLAAGQWCAQCPFCGHSFYNSIETWVLRAVLKHIVDNHMEYELRAAAELLRLQRGK